MRTWRESIQSLDESTTSILWKLIFSRIFVATTAGKATNDPAGWAFYGYHSRAVPASDFLTHGLLFQNGGNLS
jgi:hypothetical protein